MTLELGAYETICEIQPSLITTIERLLNLGQSPNQIANKVAKRDVFLAGLVEMAATHMKQKDE